MSLHTCKHRCACKCVHTDKDIDIHVISSNQRGMTTHGTIKHTCERMTKQEGNTMCCLPHHNLPNWQGTLRCVCLRLLVEKDSFCCVYACSCSDARVCLRLVVEELNILYAILWVSLLVVAHATTQTYNIHQPNHTFIYMYEWIPISIPTPIFMAISVWNLRCVYVRVCVYMHTYCMTNHAHKITNYVCVCMCVCVNVCACVCACILIKISAGKHWLNTDDPHGLSHSGTCKSLHTIHETRQAKQQHTRYMKLDKQNNNTHDTWN